MVYKATVKTVQGPIHFEYETFVNGPTVVALDGMLDEFKGTPAKDNSGQLSVKYAERTVKDCTKIDGRVYFYRGRVDDSVLVPLIGMFLEALKDKNIWQEEKPGIKLPGVIM